MVPAKKPALPPPRRTVVEDDIDRLAPVSGEIAEAPVLPEPPAAPTKSLLLADTTVIVKPLPSPLVTDAPRAKRPSDPPVVHAEAAAEIEDDADVVPPPNRTMLVLAIAGGVAVVAVIALAIGFAGGDSSVKEPAATARPVAAVTPAPEPAPAAVVAAPAVAPQPIEVVDDPAPAPPPPAITRPTTKMAKPPPVKRTRKPPPKWNPDSLFPAKR